MDAAAVATAALRILSPLIRTYWILAAGSVIVTLLPVPLPQGFKDAVVLSACRGKLWQTKPDALGFLKDWAVPQAWFLHFYLLGSVCNAATLLMYACSCCGAGAGIDQARALLALCLFQFHLARRALETAFVMRYPPDARMHVIAYAFGLSYYAVVPLSLLPPSWLFSSPPQLLRPATLLPAACLGAAARGAAVGALMRDPGAAALAAAGSAAFIAASALQSAAHVSLARLAGSRQLRSEKTAYRIPRGPLFEWVSCPHYLAEIIIYVGLALATAGSANSLLMLAWVSVNLVLAAGATQAWYHSRFKTYPAKRRALIPFIY